MLGQQDPSKPFLPLAQPTLNEFLLPEDDLITEGALLVILQYQQVSPSDLVLLQQTFALHSNLQR